MQKNRIPPGHVDPPKPGLRIPLVESISVSIGAGDIGLKTSISREELLQLANDFGGIAFHGTTRGELEYFNSPGEFKGHFRWPFASEKFAEAKDVQGMVGALFNDSSDTLSMCIREAAKHSLAKASCKRYMSIEDGDAPALLMADLPGPRFPTSRIITLSQYFDFLAPETAEVQEAAGKSRQILDDPRSVNPVSAAEVGYYRDMISALVNKTVGFLESFART